MTRRAADASQKSRDAVVHNGHRPFCTPPRNRWYHVVASHAAAGR